MKISRLLLALCCTLVGFLSAGAQDVITKNDGSTILSKVVSITDIEVSYKSYSNLDGPTYILNKSDINYITYANGSTEYFGSRIAVNNYGATTTTDAQLLQFKNFDKADHYNKIAIIGGLAIFGACAAAGVLAAALSQDIYFKYSFVAGAAGGIVLGGAWYAVWKTKANHAKQESYISSAPILEQEYPIGNNTRLTAGMDVLSDYRLNNKALGLGVRLKFQTI
jgi:hypothetical protein